MNRGRRGENVFSDKKDFEMFLGVLQESSELFGCRVAAFCLMSNHYHVLLQTPLGNLSRVMRHVNGVYTQRYNRRHKVDGQLFRGRYKSVLVQEDSHLVELLRYIHRNPVRAHICKSVSDYRWSSHHAYVSTANTQNMSSVMGSQKFTEWVKAKYYQIKKHDEVPQCKDLAPTILEIKKAVILCYEINREELEQARRGKENEPRNVAIYLSRKHSGLSLVEIGRNFGNIKYSTVSNVVRKIEDQLSDNSQLSDMVALVRRKIPLKQQKT